MNGPARTEPTLRQKAIYLSPAGAALALVGFFLPWARISCGPILDKTVSGASLGGLFWLAFALPAIMLAGFVYLVSPKSRRGRRPERWAPAFALGSAAALAVIVVNCLRLVGEARGKAGPLANHGVGFSLEFGGVATVVGLVVSLAASAVAARRTSGDRDPGEHK